MAKYDSPRRGSMAYYPRVRAKKETPSMHSYGTEAKPLSFLCYKAGMVQVLGKNVHKGSPSFGQEIVMPATVVECPPMKLFGIRAYRKDEIGVKVLGDVWAENVDKELLRKINNFKKPMQGKGKGEEQGKKGAEKGAEGAGKGHEKGSESVKKAENTSKSEEKPLTMADFEAKLQGIEYFTMLVHTEPKKIELKKTPDITEIHIGGEKAAQLAYAKERLGKDIAFNDVFAEGDCLDVKAVTKGRGFSGVIQRFNVRSQRPKSKKEKVVGSIGPWHPHTVMFTVPRPGQMGYQNRTESGKKLLKISDNLVEINSKSGLKNYGLIKDKYALIAGSLPGTVKRCISLRKSLRPETKRGVSIDAVQRVVNL